MVSSFEPHQITCNVVNPKNTPPIWGCFIPPISSQIGGGLLLALPHYMDRNEHQQTSKPWRSKNNGMAQNLWDKS